jgi:Protein of unknown function (DUF4065)
MDILTKLVTGIIFHVNKSGNYITKTKLLKLLYLVDVEYYRVHRKILTEFKWKYFHLGPWTSEYDPVLDNLVSCNQIIRTRSNKPEIDAEFYRTQIETELENIFEDFKDEFILKRILNTWGSKTTGEILDYIYFHTEPILYGERNKLLDFSVIPEEKDAFYTRSKSGKSQQEIKALRKEFKKKQEQRQQGKQTQSQFTAPKYDQEYAEAMEKLEELYH